MLTARSRERGTYVRANLDFYQNERFCGVRRFTPLYGNTIVLAFLSIKK